MIRGSWRTGRCRGRLQSFEDLNGAFDGFADDPGRWDAGGVVFAFEGQACELAAVDAAVFGPAPAQAAGPKMLDYWWKALMPSVRYSPVGCVDAAAGRPFSLSSKSR